MIFELALTAILLSPPPGQPQQGDHCASCDCWDENGNRTQSCDETRPAYPAPSQGIWEEKYPPKQTPWNNPERRTGTGDRPPHRGDDRRQQGGGDDDQ